MIHDLSNFNANLAPFWRQAPPKKPPRCLQDALGRPSLVPKKSQEPPMRRPRCAKNPARAAPEASRKRPGAKKHHRAATDSLQTSMLDHFGYTIWKGFGIILDGFFK